MKKGISIWSFKQQSLEESFKLAKEAGFDGVELALDETGEVSLETTEEEMKNIKATAQKYGLELYSIASALYWFYSLGSTDETERENAKSIVKKQLELASYAGCNTILVVAGALNTSNGENVDYDDCYNNSLNSLKELAPYAEKLKVSIALENVWNQFLISPVETAEFIDKIGSEYVGAYFDAGNILLYGQPEHWIKILNKRIKKVHIKDYKKANYSFVGLLEGDVNFPSVMASLEKIGYDDFVTAEMVPPYSTYPEVLIYNTKTAMDRIIK